MASHASPVAAMDTTIIPRVSQNKMPHWFFCRICKMIMLHVYQLVCGHLVCKGCKEKLERNNFLSCPDSSTCFTTDVASFSKIFEDRCQGRTIQSFITKCIYADSGCTWAGELSNYLSHYEECTARREEKSVEVYEAFPEDSRTLVVKRSAPHPFEIKELQKPAPVPSIVDSLVNCPYCHIGQLSREELQSHIEHECEKAEIPCPFTEVGCPEQVRQTRENLEDHLRIATEIHLGLLLRDHMSLQRTCSDEFNNLFESKKYFRQFQDDLKRVSTDVKVALEQCQTRQCILDNKISDILSQLAAMKLNSQEHIKGSLETRLKDIEAMLACFQEDRMTGTTPGDILEPRISALERMMENFKRQESRLLTLEKQLEFKDSRIESLEAQLNEGEVASRDGVLLWSITDVMRKRHEAITKKKTYILSPPFFSGTRGYKMCIRVYLNGDGQAKGTHISIFFTIMKGPFDALLPWPFKQPVHFSAISQTGAKNVEDSFRPDPNSSSFRRPKNQANISSGCPFFLPLSSLESGGFVQDDCIFIRAKVDGFSL